MYFCEVANFAEEFDFGIRMSEDSSAEQELRQQKVDFGFRLPTVRQGFRNSLLLNKSQDIKTISEGGLRIVEQFTVE